MNQHRNFIFPILILICGEIFGQNLYKSYAEAEEIFYDEQFGKALPVYASIAKVDSTYKDVRYKMEICRLLSDRQYTDTSIFNAYEKEMQVKDKFYYYWKGRVQFKGYQFEEAIQSLQVFLRSSTGKSEIIIEEARRWIDWSKRAKAFMDDPEYYEIHLLETGINSVYAELSPVFFTDKEELLFLSNRDVLSPNKFDVYHTIHEGSRKWSPPVIVGNIGTFTRDNSNIEVVDKDGRLFQFKADKGGDLFFSEPTGSKNDWSVPVEFDSKISSTHLSSHFFINEHEDRIIFAKNVGSKKDKNLDLFQSFKAPDTGNWSKPAPFASNINSEYNEDSPYLSPDEAKLYFASDGHETMGGYDIFISGLDPETLTWSAPENLGFPINSPDDELHFKLNSDLVSGYFTSNRLNTIGDYDIFFFWEIHTVKIKGRVIEGTTGAPITNARIFFRPLAYTDLYYFSILDEEGQYQTSVTAEDIFKVEIKKDDGTVTALEQFEIHATGGTNTTYIKDFFVRPSDSH
ncbi:MAG: PD40 domain-containing protein [Ekhidna sp.]|nr:PD40 domain-containing protein [Ekhidna sp.]